MSYWRALHGYQQDGTACWSREGRRWYVQVANKHPQQVEDCLSLTCTSPYLCICTIRIPRSTCAVNTLLTSIRPKLP
jgi:hypothetical protein